MRFVSLAIGSFGVRRLIPYVLLTISAICWAGNLTVGRYVYPDVMPATLSFWRWFIASVILAVIFLPAVRQQWQVVVTHWKYLFLLALSGVLMFHLLVYWSLRMTTTLNAALIISLAPVIIVVLSRWILRTSITLKQTLGVAVSLVGACVVIVRGDLSVLRSVALNSGDLLMLVALPNWALYSVLLKRKPPKLDPRAMLVATLFIGLVMTIPFTLWEINNTQAIRWSISTAAGIAYLGVFAGALAYICWNRGVGEVGANRAGLFLHLIPLFAALFAVMFLGERIQGYHLVGAALIVFGICLTNVESGLGKRGVTTAVTRATHR